MKGLYDQSFEHDACGVGLVADLNNNASHEVIVSGLSVLKNLTHRGATGNDPLTGDGAGLLFQIPDAFFRRVVPNLPPLGQYAVAMVFEHANETALIEETLRENGYRVVCWREVPVKPEAIGQVARSGMPVIRQLFLTFDPVGDGSELERKLFVLRRVLEKKCKSTFICSLSSRTIVYKGLFIAAQLEKFYPDLTEKDLTSALVLVHQRFSTNTFPSWELAHPFRLLAHNGEINTIKGNLNAMRSRLPSLHSPLLKDDMEKILPLFTEGASDSFCLDNIFELLINSGFDPAHAILMLMPQAWGAKYHMGHDIRAFYEYHSALMEPWDGPSALAFTDGVMAGAALDRNGLRPARWTLRKDGLFVLASETGVLNIAPKDVARRGHLNPGAIICLDLNEHRILENEEVKTRCARSKPYRRWVETNHVQIQGLFTEVAPSSVPEDLAAKQEFFNYDKANVIKALKFMGENGKEQVGSMGCTSPLTALSKKYHPLFDYFHQSFAQVTNPPIDSIREEQVMSIMTYIGNSGNILEETPECAKLIKLKRPILTEDELKRLSGYKAQTFPLFFKDDLSAALTKLANDALSAVKEGVKILILSDRLENKKDGELPIPSLLAAATVDKILNAAGKRPPVGIILQTAECWDVHHFAVLLSYGATAIAPYLAFETISDIFPDDPVKASSNYVKAIKNGLLKIMAKVGISTLRSYRFAKLFEIMGLSSEMVNSYFAGTPSRIGGIGLAELEQKIKELHAAKCEIKERPCWTAKAQIALREAARGNDYAKFQEFSNIINDTSEGCHTLRDLLKFKKTKAIPVEEVTPIEEILKSFYGAAMSLGSISPEAHEAIAKAFNFIGSMSNCGEGGLDPVRIGKDTDCGIKQIASGRFGVTTSYIKSAKELQIKLAQGAKPGEGGQLPGEKVNELIARLRYAKQGMTLISPPPHHDIYSIEDLAELIYDLRNVDPKTTISVKLVSEAGIGTIAAGAAKAKANKILVSGFDGGTGAASTSSIRHAGIPWELGLSEVQQTLLKNGLRGNVTLQVDGQIRTAKDIVIGAILGAEEFCFGTALLIVLGCVYDRQCHCGSCPVGIATQNECLRQKFSGKAEYLVNYLELLARETRELLASLGLRSLKEAIGRTDLLIADEALTKENKLDLSRILFVEKAPETKAAPYVFKSFDREKLLPLLDSVFSGKSQRKAVRKVTNSDRAIGAGLSGELCERYGDQNLPDDLLTIEFQGSAGQSFGAFLLSGLTLDLKGAANDFLGKGLSGGIITLSPGAANYSAEENFIAGNVIGYGATSGKIFIRGQVGERFAIRNSGALLVAEGVGDHGCEYMTDGKVVVLGPTGSNFGAGMTGGTAYVLDNKGDLDLKCNLATIELSTVKKDSPDEKELLSILWEHFKRTGSTFAEKIIKGWPSYRPKFVKIEPVA